jgi:hypothetical protein
MCMWSSFQQRCSRLTSRFIWFSVSLQSPPGMPSPLLGLSNLKWPFDIVLLWPSHLHAFPPIFCSIWHYLFNVTFISWTRLTICRTFIWATWIWTTTRYRCHMSPRSTTYDAQNSGGTGEPPVYDNIATVMLGCLSSTFNGQHNFFLRLNLFHYWTNFVIGMLSYPNSSPLLIWFFLFHSQT